MYIFLVIFLHFPFYGARGKLTQNQQKISKKYAPMVKNFSAYGVNFLKIFAKNFWQKSAFRPKSDFLPIFRNFQFFEKAM